MGDRFNTFATRIGGMRVVSLLPSATEIVYALGVEPVATSHECDHPPAAAELPSAVESRIDADASSAEIDEQVRRADDDGGVYEIDRATLRAVDPDLVIAQGMCDVCAVDTVLVEAAIDDMGLECELLTTDPHHLGDVFEDIRRIGAALDREAAAAELLDDLDTRLARVIDRVPDGRERPSVAILDWLDPVMVAGHWIPEAVECAGCRYDLADPGDVSRPRQWDEIRSADPDVLIAAPCGFEIEQTVDDLDVLTDRPGFDDLAAVRENRVYAIDGHHLLNRPGPRLVDSIEVLAAVCFPDRFESPSSTFARQLLRQSA